LAHIYFLVPLKKAPKGTRIQEVRSRKINNHNIYTYRHTHTYNTTDSRKRDIHSNKEHVELALFHVNNDDMRVFLRGDLR